MTPIYIFDVDGTITPCRSQMESDVYPKFLEFCSINKVALVTGSTKPMLEEQIPNDILNLCDVYTCLGVDGLKTFDVDYEINDDKLIETLNSIIEHSRYNFKTGNHIEIRKGMINFSIIGRNANKKQRQEYSLFDKENKQREYLISLLKQTHPNYDYFRGGAISIDIAKKGINKSLVGKDLKTLYPDSYFIFYADGILNGNDYPLAEYIRELNTGYSIQIDYKYMKNKILCNLLT